MSNDPTLRGRPEGFELTVNGMVVAADAGYVVPILGNMRRMLGLPAKPRSATTAWRKRAASAPVTARWSKVIDSGNWR